MKTTPSERFMFIAVMWSLSDRVILGRKYDRVSDDPEKEVSWFLTIREMIKRQTGITAVIIIENCIYTEMVLFRNVN